MSKFLTDLLEENIESSGYFRHHENFGYYSDILGCEIWGRKGFVNDHESIPGLRGSGDWAGVIHDEVCRRDIEDWFVGTPKVKLTIQIAASIYKEALDTLNMMKYEEDTDNVFKRQSRRFGRWTVKHVKSNFVRLNWCGFWHRWSVYSTYEEIKGNIA
jgi:hypothetical protein